MTNPTIFVPKPDREAPAQAKGFLHWLKHHVFNGWFNSALALSLIAIIVLTVPQVIQWAFIKATWVGDSANCKTSPDGACWSFIAAKFRVLMVGVYPAAESWRGIVGALVLAILIITTITNHLKGKVLIVAWLLLPVFGYWIIGGGFGLNEVDQSSWGGLMLSVLLALVGIIVSIPLGIVLALGRFSGSPITKSLCIGFIETVRGVPLITILFMSSVMMPLFLPPGFIIDNMLRIQTGMIFFSAAYVAEVVRGGLQALPKGQFEAASSLGINYPKTLYLIVLPQALRHVLPPLIGRCISMFKNTSLVIIVGLLDFLGMIKSASLDSEWLGFETEAYVFGAVVYFSICYSLSRYGAHLEKSDPVLQK
ncbi:amino acid ABC transporter permease [Cocleimonas flava]|uniref:Amino acid ABC transporter membrane protein 2 (PAAT family) n=1 Tax=Cocleimonas flava TaxID=634765 RepID=A0A4R1ETX6_9GAMM|nr:amino acid ABC transporter permease [Cocleimonas flava]TCJ83209.1 amino acid ABC transporter membrane protein 2 (PAAT family) [Cocleimonas flava]